MRISTELYQKRLIGAGYEKIYTLGPNFRNEGMDDEHLQEYYKTSYEIVGIAALPDYSSLMKSRSEFLMNNDNFCLGLVSPAQFEAIDEGRCIYRY